LEKKIGLHVPRQTDKGWGKRYDLREGLMMVGEAVMKPSVQVLETCFARSQGTEYIICAEKKLRDKMYRAPFR